MDLTVDDNLSVAHSFVDGLSVVSDADLESLSEHTNGSPQASDRQDAGDTREICYTARSTLLRYCTAQHPINPYCTQYIFTHSLVVDFYPKCLIDL